MRSPSANGSRAELLRHFAVSGRFRRSTDTTLIRRAQSRDADAWSQLVDLYGPLVFYWCRRKGQFSSADASDVFQAFH